MAHNGVGNTVIINDMIECKVLAKLVTIGLNVFETHLVCAVDNT